jgi:DNA-binding response OmpR family regulator
LHEVKAMTFSILLADDEAHILRAAEIKFKRNGFEVRCASDGEEAWSLIQEHRPDILITDCQMPRLDGLSLARRIRATPSVASLPIVMLTAKGYELRSENVQEELRLEAVLAKPFSPRDLVARVEAILAGCRQPEPASAV